MTLYPRPREIYFSGDSMSLTALTVEGPCTKLFIAAARSLSLPAVSAPHEDAGILLYVDTWLSKQEEYVLNVDEVVSLRGGSEEALARGIWTLLSLIKKSGDGYELPRCCIRDHAYMPIRGVHLYLPPSDGIDECMRFLNVLARLKYNTVFLEIGGGMQYDTHPEVNHAWTKFCREAHAHTGGPQGLQASEAYWKDSTHVELAGGSYLTKPELKKLCDHIRLLRMEIIPEIQALSHAYYLTLADRSIAERPYERWPDSYCPSNDASYKLYEECAQEVLDVIKPQRVSIGHDEVRILGECPRCKGKSGHELLASDINRLYDFYHAQNIGVMMWGEKLQNFESFKGIPTGGVEIPERIDRYGRRYSMPATHEAIDHIPKDIVMLDWYYKYASDTEVQFGQKGFKEIFGNFAGSTIADWAIRSRSGNVLGGEVSTWCVPSEHEVGYNGWFYELAFSAEVLWRTDFSDAMRNDFAMRAESVQPELRAMMGERKFDGSRMSLRSLSLAPSAYATVRPELHISLQGDLPMIFADNGLGTAETFDIEALADRLVFFHAAENPPERRIYTWFFLDPAPMCPASYAVDYTDGLTLRIPVGFPEMTGAYRSSPTYMRPGSEVEFADIDDDREAVANKPSPVYVPTDPYRAAAVYFCDTAHFESPEGYVSVYAYEWTNPRPDVPVMRVRLINEEKSTITLKCFGVGVV
ncbi:MAG: family 20 glycosylhydrolase [Clostridiales bacterium]|nr:family 20 glycosylhydrolase [Clostridiales bacterium]